MLKRRIKAIMRSIIKKDSEKNNILIIVKPEALKLTFRALKEEIMEKIQNGRNF